MIFWLLIFWLLIFGALCDPPNSWTAQARLCYSRWKNPHDEYPWVRICEGYCCGCDHHSPTSIVSQCLHLPILISLLRASRPIIQSCLILRYLRLGCSVLNYRLLIIRSPPRAAHHLFFLIIFCEPDYLFPLPNTKDASCKSLSDTCIIFDILILELKSGLKISDKRFLSSPLMCMSLG